MLFCLASSLAIHAAPVSSIETRSRLLVESRARLARAARNASALGLELRIGAAARATDHPALVHVATRAFDRTLAHFRRAVGHQIRLAEVIVSQIETQNGVFETFGRITAHHAGRITSHGPFASTARALEAEYEVASAFAGMRRALGLPRVVHSLRAFPEVLRSVDVQIALADVVVDRLVATAARGAWTRSHPRGWRLEPSAMPAPSTSVAWIQEKTAPTRFALNPDLTQILIHELATNASFASRRRHCGEALETKPIFSRRRIEDGRSCLDFEDFGDPRQMEGCLALGESHDPRFGVGLGRFHAELIADFLGYEQIRWTKAGDSGSVVRIIIPGDQER